MNTPATDSTPLRERLLPQTSIRFFMVLMVGCAIVMYIFRAAIIDGSMWARIMVLLIQTIGISFAGYALLFLIANLFSATSAPIIEAIENSDRKPNSEPAIENPLTDPLTSSASDIDGGAT